MTTPREPDGPYERGRYGPDPYDRDPEPYGRSGRDAEESPTWGRAPAGGWGAAAPR